MGRLFGFAASRVCYLRRQPAEGMAQAQVRDYITKPTRVRTLRRGAGRAIPRLRVLCDAAADPDVDATLRRSIVRKPVILYFMARKRDGAGGNGELRSAMDHIWHVRLHTYDELQTSKGPHGGEPPQVSTSSTRSRRRQVHFWLSEREHGWLSALAGRHDESVAATLRRLLRAAASDAAVGRAGDRVQRPG